MTGVQATELVEHHLPTTTLPRLYNGSKRRIWCGVFLLDGVLLKHVKLLFRNLKTRFDNRHLLVGGGERRRRNRLVCGVHGDGVSTNTPP